MVTLSFFMISLEDDELVHMWPGMRSKSVFRTCVFSSDSGFRGFSGPACRILFALSFHTLDLFIVHFTECMY